MPRSIGHDPFIAMTMMKKKEKGTKKKVMNIKCDRSSQDDDTRVPSGTRVETSGTRVETSGNPRFEKDKTSEMETSPPSPQTQRVKKRPLERALPLCACPISIAASTLMDLSRSLLTSPIENEKSSCFYSSLGEKCEKTTKTELVSTKKPSTKTVRKKKENISICTSGTSKEVLCLHIIDSTCGKLGLLAARVIETSESGGKDVM